VEIINLRRKELNAPLHALSEVTTVTGAQLSKVFNGQNRLRAATLYQAACLLKIPISYCFPPQSAELEYMRENAGRFLDSSKKADFEQAQKIHEILCLLWRVDKVKLRKIFDFLLDEEIKPYDP